MLFFVLSGFVIFHSVTVNPLDLNLRNYAVKRIRRIYPIFLCALAISYLCQEISIRSFGAPDWRLLMGNLAMLQDVGLKPGVWFFTFYDRPLWSLSYECWFYVLFIALIQLQIAPHRRQFLAALISLVGVLSYLAFPNQASLFLMYFMIWWCGAELAREYAECGRITCRRQLLPIGMLTALATLWWVPLIKAVLEHDPLQLDTYPALICRHIFAAIGFICVGILWYRIGFLWFDRLLGGFAIFAPISYAMYAIHSPIIVAANSFSPGHHSAIKIVCSFALTLGLAWLLERRLQPAVNRWTKRFLNYGPAPKASSRRPGFGRFASRPQAAAAEAG